MWALAQREFLEAILGMYKEGIMKRKLYRGSYIRNVGKVLCVSFIVFDKSTGDCHSVWKGFNHVGLEYLARF